jgi:hypothetical protein
VQRSKRRAGARTLERCGARGVQVEVVVGIEKNVLFRLLPELTDQSVPASFDRPVTQ